MRDVRSLLKEMDQEKLAHDLDVSSRLIEIVENGGYTTPKIVNRIQDLLNLTDEEAKQLISPNRSEKEQIEKGWRLRVPYGKMKPDIKTREYYGYKRYKFKDGEGV